MFERSTLGPIVEKIATDAGLDPLLVAAVILQESSGCIFAVRYEPSFYIRYVRDVPIATMAGHVPKNSVVSNVTERALRSTSLGLMQIMGQVARENNFKEDQLLALIDPVKNVTLGCRILSRLLDKHGRVEAALLRWNGGGDPEYPDKVLARIDNGEAAAFLRPVV